MSGPESQLNPSLQVTNFSSLLCLLVWDSVLTHKIYTTIWNGLVVDFCLLVFGDSVKRMMSVTKLWSSLFRIQPSHISLGFDIVSYQQACPVRSGHFPVENVLSSLAWSTKLEVARFHGGTTNSMTLVIREGVLERFQDIRLSFSLS